MVTTMVIAQQPAILDIGGVFPLLTASGVVDPTSEGQMRQAG